MAVSIVLPSLSHSLFRPINR